MSSKRHLVETVTLILAAILCASVSNLFAARERKLALRGTYPNALEVPAQQQEGPDVARAAIAPPAGATPETHVEAAAPAVAEATPATLRPAPATAATTGVAKGAPTPRPAVAQTTAPAPPSPADLLSRFPPHKDKPYVEISGDDVALLVKSGALVLDARRTNVYQEGHIAGARSFSVWESDIDEKVTALLGEGREPVAPVVLYCSGGDCEDSHMLAQKLWGAGWENLLVYHDGWPDWQKRRGASRTGEAP